MSKRNLLILTAILVLLVTVPWTTVGKARVDLKGKTMAATDPSQMPAMRSITAAQRKAAADRAAAARAAAGYKYGTGPLTAPAPGGTPDYFGIYPNWTYSPLPVVDAQIVIHDPTGTGATAQAMVSSGVIVGITITNGGTGYTLPTVAINSATGSGASATAAQAFGVVNAITLTAGGSGYAVTGGLRKFINGLPGLNLANANNLGQYIPVAIADTTTYPGSDYYEIQLTDHSERMHGDLLFPGTATPAPTKLRGYSQTNTADATVSAPHYLGPLIIGKKGIPVRVRFSNNLGAGSTGDLFIPCDTTEMGAGMGPTGGIFQQNRATLHLHGGLTPWISDGTPHQWTVPVGDTAATYQKGMSAYDIPDMTASGQGRLTFYYPNQQSSRLMFYHDHAYGTTRLNVYAGEAAGYLIVDPTEESLITNGSLPNLGGVYRYGVPLIIQDKTFVDQTTIPATDPTWNWGTTPGTPVTGNLWFPHVYIPNQNPWDPMGVNAMGRWDYALWFWPPYTGLLAHGTIPNPYAALPGEPPQIPGIPNPSLVPEAFLDTPLVNGTAYPYLLVEPKIYRFRVLNACNDRSINLQLYQADPAGHTVTDITGTWGTEVKMVPASGAGWPPGWPTPDGRAGGWPDPTLMGPSIIQIGSEGGMLPAPVTIPNRPVGYDYNRRSVTVLNVLETALMMGPAVRSDIVVDFSAFAGKTIILYNDAPAPVPALDPRNDYYTGDPDQTSTGGAPMTQPGYGPNTRTIMQFRVGNAVTTATTFNPAALPAAYAASQEPPIVPESAYNAAYGASYTDTYVHIQDTSVGFTPVGQTTAITMPLQPKAIQELFELNYGKMNATLGVELPFSNGQNQTTIPYGYVDPPTELILNSDKATPVGSLGDGTQIWKITHNGVDTHAIHVHLFDAQLINRVGWDGQIKPPEPNEQGWMETIRMNPLEDIIIALRPVAPTLPFQVPDSIRPLDVTSPIGSPANFFNLDPNGNPVTITNQLFNFGWEYVWHCHLLGHEENDMMRAMAFVIPPAAPSNLIVVGLSGPPQARLTWKDNSANETGFLLERAMDTGFSANLVSTTVGPHVTIYVDSTVVPGTTYYYRVTASNTVGGQAPGFPSLTANSTPSNTATYSSATPILAPVDFNADGREDVLWRFYGTGGANMVWYLGQPLAMNGFQKITSNGTNPAEARIMGNPGQGGRVAGPTARVSFGEPTEAGGFSDKAPGKIFKEPSEAASARPAKETSAGAPAQETMAEPPRGTLVLRSPMENAARILGQVVIGSAPLPAVTNTNWHIDATGDFNGDGKVDLVWRNYSNGFNVIWYMNGVTQISAGWLPTVTSTSWHIAATGDLNGDGKPDLLWRNTAAGYVTVWYMNGLTVTGSDWLPTVSDTNWQIGGTGDFNADGKADILWRNLGAGLGYDTVWYMNGHTLTGSAWLPSVTDTNWQIAGTGDFNGDGMVDILWRNYGAGLGTDTIWYMNGIAMTSSDFLPAQTDTTWRIENR